MRGKGLHKFNVLHVVFCTREYGKNKRLRPSYTRAVNLHASMFVSRPCVCVCVCVQVLFNGAGRRPDDVSMLWRYYMEWNWV